MKNNSFLKLVKTHPVICKTLPNIFLFTICLITIATLNLQADTTISSRDIDVLLNETSIETITFSDLVSGNVTDDQKNINIVAIISNSSPESAFSDGEISINTSDPGVDEQFSSGFAATRTNDNGQITIKIKGTGLGKAQIFFEIEGVTIGPAINVNVIGVEAKIKINDESVPDTFTTQVGIDLTFTDDDIENKGLTADEIPIEEYLWAFGDGDISNEPNPNHAYKDPGIYVVTLTISVQIDDIGGSIRDETSIVVVVEQSGNSASRVINILLDETVFEIFTFSESPDAPAIASIDTSNVVEISWADQDKPSSVDSEIESIKFTDDQLTDGNADGSGNIALRIKALGGGQVTVKVEVDGKSRELVINVLNVIADYTIDGGDFEVVGGTDVKFIDNSTGDIKEWSWDFGDGTTSTDENPIHRYEKIGRFDVTLKIMANTPIGNVISKKIKTVCINSFSAEAPTGSALGLIERNINLVLGEEISDTLFFHENDIPLDNVSVSVSVSGFNIIEISEEKKALDTFGDDSTVINSEGDNPLNLKTDEDGVITLKIKASDINAGQATVRFDFELNSQPVSEIIVVNVLDVFPDFTTENFTITADIETEFIDTSLGNIVAREWDFGDGSEKSFEKNPTHVYTGVGEFEVNLKILAETAFGNIVGEISKTVCVNSFSSEGPTGSSIGVIKREINLFVNETITDTLLFQDENGPFVNIPVTIKVDGFKIIQISEVDKSRQEITSSPDSIDFDEEQLIMETDENGAITIGIKALKNGLSNINLDFMINENAVTEQIIVHVLDVEPLFTINGKDSTSVEGATVILNSETQFKDVSKGDVIERVWNFGDDGSSSLEPEPIHIFIEEGPHIVTLEILAETEVGNLTKSTTSEILVVPPKPINGTIIGAVFSQKNIKPLEGAKVTLIGNMSVEGVDEKLEIKRSTFSKSDGVYGFEDVPVGKYTLSACKADFQCDLQGFNRPINLQSGETVIKNFQLRE